MRILASRSAWPWLPPSLVSLAGCHSSSSPAAPPGGYLDGCRARHRRPPVRKTLRLESVQPGQIEAFEQTPLFAKLPGLRREALRGHRRPRGGQSTARGPVPSRVERRTPPEGGGGGRRPQAEIELAAAAVRAAEAAVATAQANVSAAEAGNIRAEADVTRWQSQYARISQLVAGGSLDRKLEDETRDSLKAAEAARGEARAKVEAAKATLAAKPGRFGQGQGQRSRGPRPPRKRRSRPGRASRPCSSTRKSAPRMPAS